MEHELILTLRRQDAATLSDDYRAIVELLAERKRQRQGVDAVRAAQNILDNERAA